MPSAFARTVAFVLAVLVAGAAAPAAQAPDAAGRAIPFDRSTAMWLVTLPLGCIDKLHDAPRSRGYVYEAAFTLKPGFQKTRAFYGCSDWHSAVNSTWTMVKVLKTFPDLPLAQLIREKLAEHLTAEAIKGEVAFFEEEGNKAFERPYGWAWLFRVYAELKSWDDADAKKWAANMEPLVKLLLERTMPYLKTLAEPMRIGTHQNTAYALKLLNEYARGTGDKELQAAVAERARRFFMNDYGCAPNVEVSGSDFFSPCLVEAAIMGDILDPPAFAAWLDKFMPAPGTPAFTSLKSVNMEMPGTAEELKKADMLGAKAHLVGLGVSRARAMEDIAASLPPSDPRVGAYHTAATALAQISIKAMYDASYAGTHWIATYIVDYLVSGQRRHGPTTTSSK
jgi:Protein of unknown function (DUF2891)